MDVTPQPVTGPAARSESLALDDDAASTLSFDLAGTALAVFSGAAVSDTLARVVDMAVATIGEGVLAGVILVAGNVVTAAVSSDAVVAELDDLQQRSGEGPCLDAITHGLIVSAGDLGDDPRWPTFGSEATAKGIGSVLALPLLADGTIGALNLYARHREAFGVGERARGLLVAGLSAFAVSAAVVHETHERRTAHLNKALVSREVIGLAQGILMERERYSAAQAFDILSRASKYLNIKLRDVAQTLVDTGETPDRGPLMADSRNGYRRG